MCTHAIDESMKVNKWRNFFFTYVNLIYSLSSCLFTSTHSQFSSFAFLLLLSLFISLSCILLKFQNVKKRFLSRFQKKSISAEKSYDTKIEIDNVYSWINHMKNENFTHRMREREIEKYIIVKWSQHFEMQSSSFLFILFRFVFFLHSHTNSFWSKSCQRNKFTIHTIRCIPIRWIMIVFIFINSDTQCLFLSYDFCQFKNDFDIDECNTFFFFAFLLFEEKERNRISSICIRCVSFLQ